MFLRALNTKSVCRSMRSRRCPRLFLARVTTWFRLFRVHRIFSAGDVRFQTDNWGRKAILPGPP